MTDLTTTRLNFGETHMKPEAHVMANPDYQTPSSHSERNPQTSTCKVTPYLQITLNQLFTHVK